MKNAVDVCISKCGSDRGTAYTMSPKVLRRQDAVLLTWLDAPSEPGAESGAMFGVFDAASSDLRGAYAISSALDNHCGPAMVMDHAERVHVVIGGHHTAFQYRWTDAPHDPASWSAPELLGPADSYPGLAVDQEGTLHLVHREQMGGYMSPWQLWYRRKRPGRDWETPVPLAVSPVLGYNHFMQTLTVGPAGTLHVTFQFHYSDTDRSRDGWGRAAVYLHSENGGDHWYNEDRRLTGPLTVDQMQPVGGNAALPGEKGLSISNHFVDDRNAPWFFSSHPQYPSGLIWHREPSGWQMIDMADRTRGLNIGHGGSTSLARLPSGRVIFLFTADTSGNAWPFGAVGGTLYETVLDATGKLVRTAPLRTADAESSCWLPSLERWDWTAPGRREGDDVWFLYTRGINHSTVENGRNANASRTRIHLGNRFNQFR